MPALAKKTDDAANGIARFESFLGVDLSAMDEAAASDLFLSGGIPADVPAWSAHIASFIGSESYAYPMASTIDFLRVHARRLVEIGAGSALFAKALHCNGFDIIATDGFVPGFEDGRTTYEFTHGRHHPTLVMNAANAVRAYADRDVMLVMPPGEDLWFAEAIDAIREPGRRLFYGPDIGNWLNPTERECACYPGIAASAPILRKRFRVIGETRTMTVPLVALECISA